jgi:hypothetical protein
MVLYFLIDPLSDGLLLLNDIREIDPCDLLTDAKKIFNYFEFEHNVWEKVGKYQ